MSGTSIGITRRLRDSISKSDARNILSFVITLGFFGIIALHTMGEMTAEQFDGIMNWVGPIQVTVTIFYFGLRRENGNNNDLRENMQRMTEQLGKLAPQLQNTITTVNMHGNLIGELLAKFREDEQEDERPKPSTGRTGMDTGLQETDGHGRDPSEGI